MAEIVGRQRQKDVRLHGRQAGKRENHAKAAEDQRKSGLQDQRLNTDQQQVLQQFFGGGEAGDPSQRWDP